MTDPFFYLALCYGVAFVLLLGSGIYFFRERIKYRVLESTLEKDHA